MASEVGEVVHLDAAVAALMERQGTWRVLVQPDMVREAVWVDKLFPTLIALEQLFPRVDILVLLQIMSENKTLITE